MLTPLSSSITESGVGVLPECLYKAQAGMPVRHKTLVKINYVYPKLYLARQQIHSQLHKAIKL